MSSMTNRLAASPPVDASPKCFTFGDPTAVRGLRVSGGMAGSRGKIRTAEISSTLAIFGPEQAWNRRRHARLASRQCGRRHGRGRMNRHAEAARLGIEADYTDAYGKRRTVSPDVIDKLLHA